MRLIRYLFELEDWLAAAAIIAFLAATAVLLCALSRLPSFLARAKAASFAGPDLLILLGFMFGLNIGFLSVEIEDRIGKAALAVGAEGNAFQSLASMLGRSQVQAEAEADTVRVVARAYLQGVLQREFTGDRRTIEFASASRKMEAFVAAATAFALAGPGSDAVRGIVLEQALAAAQARAQRVAMMSAQLNQLRWLALLVLLVLLQIGIALVHGAEPRRMISHMCLLTVAGALCIGVAAVSEDPFTPPRMVSIAPLEDALATLTGPPPVSPTMSDHTLHAALVPTAGP